MIWSAIWKWLLSLFSKPGRADLKLERPDFGQTVQFNQAIDNRGGTS